MKYLTALAVAGLLALTTACGEIREVWVSPACESARAAVKEYVETGGEVSDEKAAKQAISACFEGLTGELLEIVRDRLLAEIGGAFGGIIFESTQDGTYSAAADRADALTNHVLEEYHKALQ